MITQTNQQSSSKFLNFFKIVGLVAVFFVTMVETGSLSQAAKA